MELDIQGLRCIAVLFVVLFHLWPTVFKNGFLGVDIFFVISGYLMHNILSSKEFTTQNVITFYFRRVRRIVPTYISVLILTVFASIYFFVPSEYPTILRELSSAASFTSNIFNLPAQGYFAIKNAFPLFLHTWSLSVELQFYLIVPGIYYLYHHLQEVNKIAGIGFVMAIGLVSLGYQVYNREDVNLAHMGLFSRVWQFLIGFLVNALQPKQAEGLYQKLPLHEEESLPVSTFNYKFVIKYILVIALLAQLYYPISSIAYFNRFLCTLTSALFIMIKEKTFLESSVVVYVGDVSYSIYLLHWPGIIIAKYVADWEVDGPGIPEGTILIQGVFVTSILVEKAFKDLSACITNWPRLLFVLFVLYIALGSSALFMESLEPQMSLDLLSSQLQFNETNNTTAPQFPLAELAKIPMAKPFLPEMAERNRNLIEKTITMYEHRNNLTLTNDEAIAMVADSEIHRDEGQRQCRAELIMKLGNTSFSNQFIACQVEGTGDKEILIIGNSLALDLFVGMRTRWRHLYKRLSIYADLCVIPIYTPDGATKPEGDFLSFVEKWDRPIDTLIVRHSYYQFSQIHPDCKNVPMNDDYVAKHLLKQAQEFYNQASRLAKLVVMGFAEYESGFKPQKLAKALVEGKISSLNFNFTRSQQHAAKVNDVIAAVNCTNCMKVDFMADFCSHVTDTCYAVTEHRIPMFVDNVHLTVFGDFVIADLLLDAVKKHRQLFK